MECSVEKLTPLPMFIFINEREEIGSSGTVPTKICNVLLMDKTGQSRPLKWQKGCNIRFKSLVPLSETRTQRTLSKTTLQKCPNYKMCSTQNVRHPPTANTPGSNLLIFWAREPSEASIQGHRGIEFRPRIRDTAD